jgi:multiple sugar transport system permease protein
MKIKRSGASPGSSIATPAQPNGWQTLLLLSPYIATFIVFGLLPPLYGLLISFFNYSLLNPKWDFAGLGNYTAVLSDPIFWHSLRNSALYTICTVPLTICLALALAAILNGPLPLRALFRSGFFLPTVTSVVVLALVFKYLYASGGWADRILLAVGLKPPSPSWLLNPSLALAALMAMAVWSSIGFYAVLFLAAMQGIPSSLYEVAGIEGANPVQRFWYITIPMLRPTIGFAVFLATINAMQVFPEVFTMTQGGPMGSTTTLVYWIYELGFTRFRMGLASAATVYLVLVLAAVIWIQSRLFRTGRGIED